MNKNNNNKQKPLLFLLPAATTNRALSLSSRINRETGIQSFHQVPSSKSPPSHMQTPLKRRKILSFHEFGQFMQKPRIRVNISESDQQQLKPKKQRVNRNSLDKAPFFRQLTDVHSDTQVNDQFEYVLKYAIRTKRGVGYNNQAKINQDAYIVCPNIGKKSYMHYFSVCDGHGHNGHFVSNFLKHHIPQLINLNKGQLEKKTSQALKYILQQASNKMINTEVDITFSGSTSVSVFMLHNQLYCSNVGDSRAIGLQRKPNGWHIQQLSRDHKPDQQDEAERIINLGGRIEAYRDNRGNYAGPLRVWCNATVPGLAMTRSFGDLAAKSVGVIDAPEIKIYQLDTQWRVLLIGSDGLFEFVSNEELMQLITPFYDREDLEGACDRVMLEAVTSWTDRCSIVDDITFVLIFMNY